MNFFRSRTMPHAVGLLGWLLILIAAALTKAHSSGNAQWAQNAAKATAAKPAPAGSQATAAKAPARAKTDREKVVAAALKDAGVREKTGNNDGPRIAAYLKNTGLVGRYPYCAAAVVTWYLEGLGELPKGMPRSALAADMVRNPTWRQGKGVDPRPADTFGIWYSGGVHHTGIVIENLGNRVKTCEGNTSPDATAGSAADREAGKGGGVFPKIRYKTAVYSFKSWLP